ncbi:hypothetical protein [Argonema galeatum]|uniref:hypothetical protein n=1 Tax=Argonema galeatum TaxID=2942762 RepID=UPI0020132A42|nr:hypothetical protein [Argonema galeatum]MCL1462837.1 hypothetical protein [Argonema galeatum A003/A1]
MTSQPKPEFNCKQALKLFFFSAAMSLFLTPFANGAETIKFDGRPIEIAQARNNGCPTNRYLLRLAETRNYTVRICATEGGTLTYISRGKNGRGGITLPGMVDMGDRYEAVNGNTRYRISRNYLTVNQGSRIILRERVTRWVVGRGLQ